MGKVTEKIEKLLALANNNSSEDEAESAMLLAQKLLAENGLSMADVEQHETEKQPVNEIMTRQMYRLPWWHGTLAAIICENFKCEHVIHYYRTEGIYSGACVRFLGHPDDLEICKRVYTFAVYQITELSRRYVKSYKARCYKPVNAAGIKNDYITGFLCGMREKFRAQVEENQWGLVVQSDEEVQAALKKLITGKRKISTIRSAGSIEAQSAGYARGKDFEPAVGEISS
jgi:maltooligosyltrehalose synthase